LRPSHTHECADRRTPKIMPHTISLSGMGVNREDLGPRVCHGNRWQPIIPDVPTPPWQPRIQRAEELLQRHNFAAEILNFYIAITRFQEGLYTQCSTGVQPSSAAFFDSGLSPEPLSKLGPLFSQFLNLVERSGPSPLVDLATRLQTEGEATWSELLQDAWRISTPTAAEEFLAQAFLQPYAEHLRALSAPESATNKHASCPFCHRKPTLGVLRPLGEGAARSLVCSFCLAEWNFRRLVCPGCGEENDRMLSVYTAGELEYIRVECCDSCRTYIKSIDLTKDGRAEPVVDELASIPLDLWAQDRGYAKLRQNILGM